MTDNYRPSDWRDAENADYPAAGGADEYPPPIAVDGEFYAIGFPDDAGYDDDRRASSVATALPPSPSPPEVDRSAGRHDESAFHKLSTTSSPLFSPFPQFGKPPSPPAGRRRGSSSDEEVFPDTPYTPYSAQMPLPSPHRISPVGGRPQVAPSAGSPTPTGTTLVETIVPGGRPQPNPRETTPRPTAAGSACRGNSLRKVGTVKRSMSMRGGKPRVTKVRVVNKTDSKSYFSVERTMYQWIYMSAIILGNSLTFYGVVSLDPNVVHVAHISATLLSFLAIVVAYYAAVYAFRRRLALDRQAEAAAFDDRFGPVAIVTVIIIVFVAAEALTLKSAIKQINGKSFGLKVV